MKYASVLLGVAAGLVVILAGWLWWVDTHIETDDVYTAAPANTSWVEVGTSQIAYQHFPAESETNVLLIGGTTAWSGVWRNTVEDLKGTANLYALDLPPFGYTVVESGYRHNLIHQAQVINGFVEALQLEGTVLVAHSYGAGPAMEAVLQAPGNYSQFILIDGAIHVDQADSPVVRFVQNLFAVPTFRSFIASVALHLPGFMEASLKYLVYDISTVTDFWVTVYNQPLTVDNQSQRIAQWFYDFVFENGVGLSSDSANYRSLTVPTVILWGREDTLTPLEQGLKLHEIIPTSELVILDEVGHIPMIDDHEQYIDVVRENLAR